MGGVEFPATVMVRTPLDAAAVMPLDQSGGPRGRRRSADTFNAQETMQEIVSRSMDSQRFPWPRSIRGPGVVAPHPSEFTA